MTKDSYDPLFEEIAKLMKFAYENAHKPVPPEKEQEFNKKIDELEKQVNLYKSENEKLLASMGYSDFHLESLLKDTEEQEKFTEDQKKSIKKADELKKEAVIATTDIQKAAEIAESKNKKTKAAPAKSGKARKSKFRGMGGDSKWQKL